MTKTAVALTSLPFWLLAAGADAVEPPRMAAVDAVLSRYVEGGRLAGVVALVSKRGQIVHLGANGRRRVDAPNPILATDRFRIASMTKPVTSVAALILLERGKLSLDDPVARFVREFSEVRVYESAATTRPPIRPITIRDLLTHTSGLTSGVFERTPVDALYREAGGPPQHSLEDFARRLAAMPLVTDPGRRWIYSHSTNVLGRVIEVASGSALDEFFEAEIFRPLRMAHTGFVVDDATALAAVHSYDDAGRLVARSGSEDPRRRPAFLSATGGLFSTAGDYHRFAQMLLRHGELDGVRVLREDSVRAMASNQLAAELLPWGVGGRPERGHGFGFGVGVVLDRVAAGFPGSNGTFYWAGSLNTSFWVDPAQGVVAIVLAQLDPFRAVPIERDLQAAVYEALRTPAPGSP